MKSAITGKVRKTVIASMAALMLFGAGAVATQAGFQDTATSTLTGGVGTVSITPGGNSNVNLNFTESLAGHQGLRHSKDYKQSVTIENDGTLPVTVTWERDGTAPAWGSGVTLTSTGATGSGNNTLSTHTPASFDLNPGQNRVVEFTLRIPQSASGAAGQSMNVKYNITATQK